MDDARKPTTTIRKRFNLSIPMNELEKIRRAIRVYEGKIHTNLPEWKEAESYLLKVHRTYGTIDVGIIRSLIR